MQGPSDNSHPSDEHGTGDEIDPILTVERAIDLDTDADEIWHLAGTADGWTQWLVDEAEIHVAEGATGTVIDDGVTFEVSIDRVDHGRSITYRWSDAEDRRVTTLVQITIEPRTGGGSRLTINERGPLMASASTWEVREGLFRMVAWLASATVALVLV